MAMLLREESLETPFQCESVRSLVHYLSRAVLGVTLVDHADLTGGGGRHLYFAHPGGLSRNRAGFAQGIDLRGDGGYIVAPPSIHPTGRPYTWAPGRAPDEITLAALPRWIIVPIRGPRNGRSLSDWRPLVREGVAEGQRNSTIASLTGHMLWHGVDPDVALELLLAWNRVRCRPPLDDAEVAQVVASIARLHDSNLKTPT
jgi:hypothetical protein